MKLSYEKKDEIEKEYKIMMNTNCSFIVQVISESFYEFDEYCCFVMEFCHVNIYNYN